MRGNEIKIFGLLIAVAGLWLLCLDSGNQLDELALRSQSLQMNNRNRAKLENDISKTLLAFMVFNRGDPIVDHREFMRNMARQTNIGEVLFRESPLENQYFRASSVEIKFSTATEQQAYNFLEAICKNYAGIVEFCLLEIIRKNENDDFDVKIQCKLYAIDKNTQNSVDIINKKSVPQLQIPPPLRIFQLDKRQRASHVLQCAIENTKALVDDHWLKVEDYFDNFKIARIHHDSIELEQTTQNRKIRVGETFNF
ncbi:MAG: hypothetical protein LBT67_00570 [Holosporaceae bacterium]|jgi:hypothetical protein|nr:hypothetical protein [Holosporaceae bacterium]